MYIPTGYKYKEVPVSRHDPPKSREAAVFKSNRSQAVRIPKELAFPGDVKRVTIIPVEGGGLLLRPVTSTWAEYFKRENRPDDAFVEEMLAAVNNDPPPDPIEPFD
jgi:antitoxin VapB